MFMHKLGTVLAFITNKIFIILLVVATLVFAQVVAITSVVSDKTKVKTVLSTANIYKTLPENVLYVVKASDTSGDLDKSAGESPQKTLAAVLEENGFISPKDLTKTITAVVPPEFLKKQTESVIDGTYDYLEGTTNEPSFTISLKDRAGVAKKEIGSLVSTKLASLPVCSAEQMRTQGADIQILEASCLPPGVSLQAEVDSFTSDLTGSEGVFAKEFTQKDIDISDADAATARFAYSALQSMQWIFWLLFFSFSIVVIVTAKTLHRGLKTVGVINVCVGGLLMFGYLFYVSNLDIVNMMLSNAKNMDQQQLLAIESIGTPLFKAFASQVTGQIVLISTVVMVFGIGCFILGVIATKHHIEHLYLPHHKPVDIVPPESNQKSEDEDNTSNSPRIDSIIDPPM